MRAAASTSSFSRVQLGCSTSVRKNGTWARSKASSTALRIRETSSMRRGSLARYSAAVRMIYVSIDVEASGPFPGLYYLVSVGAAPIVRLRDVWVVDRERTFYAELKPARSEEHTSEL